jgi:hypothetical protein
MMPGEPLSSVRLAYPKLGSYELVMLNLVDAKLPKFKRTTMKSNLATKMPINPIFNPDGDDRIENRSIWFGNTTNLMQLNDVRYNWAIGLYQQMRENFWIN